MDTHRYMLNYPQVGLGIIVCNTTFINRKRRDGGKNDILMMEECMKRLGFAVEIWPNEIASDLENKFKKLASRDLSAHSCFMCVISTHGNAREDRDGGRVSLEHVIYCWDNVILRTRDILTYFKDSNCPTMKSKPRIFIMQACRGKGVDDGHKVAVLASHGADPRPANNDTRPRETREMIEIGGWEIMKNFLESFFLPQKVPETESIVTPAPCYKDFLVIYASPPGQVAYGYEDTGSIFLGYLCDVLKQHRCDSVDFLEVVTKASFKMASEFQTDHKTEKAYHLKCCVPWFSHMLTKDLYFKVGG